jgi:hypothetical protein
MRTRPVFVLAFWTVPVLWRFRLRAFACRRLLLPTDSKSARGLAQSKTFGLQGSCATLRHSVLGRQSRFVFVKSFLWTAPTQNDMLGPWENTVPLGRMPLCTS